MSLAIKETKRSAGSEWSPGEGGVGVGCGGVREGRRRVSSVSGAGEPGKGAGPDRVPALPGEGASLPLACKRQS